MKTLIFSDSHISKYFDQAKFDFLTKIISSVDQVIINGDFWEGYTTKFDELLISPWNKLFPLLLKKKAIYLYGNHDKKRYSNHNVSLFSVQQAKEYKFISGNKTFYVEHGDRLLPLWDRFFFRMPAFIMKILDSLEGGLLKIFGQHFLKIAFEDFNKAIKKTIKGSLKANEFLICGHTELAEIDLKTHYINSGLVKHGFGQYVIVEDGKIKLYKKRY